MRAVLVCLALFSLAACDSSTGPSGASISGTYTLKTVDDKPLPAAFTDSSFISGQLVVTDSGWAQTTVVQYVAGGNPAGDTLTQAGAWETSGSNVTLYDYSKTTLYTGTYTSAAMSLTTNTGTRLSYSK
jgi:hypothetical protein